VAPATSPKTRNLAADILTSASKVDVNFNVEAHKGVNVTFDYQLAAADLTDY
jgi:hypothetical protein